MGKRVITEVYAPGDALQHVWACRFAPPLDPDSEAYRAHEYIQSIYIRKEDAVDELDAYNQASRILAELEDRYGD